MNNLQMKYGYGEFRKFEGGDFGDQPSIRQICQCFLLPTFSVIGVQLYILYKNNYEFKKGSIQGLITAIKSKETR